MLMELQIKDTRNGKAIANHWELNATSMANQLYSNDTAITSNCNIIVKPLKTVANQCCTNGESLVQQWYSNGKSRTKQL